jgi:hypothetical protein
MTADQPDVFLQLSAALTGVSQRILGYAEEAAGYRGILVKHIGAENVNALLTAYATYAAQGLPPAEIARRILNDQPAPLPAAARALMKLWYTGIWVQPFDYPPYTTKDAPVIDNMEAYAQSLAWQVAQAHPIGVSRMRFGYWANVPPPLADFVGDGK